MALDFFDVLKLHLEAEDKPHPAEGEVDDGGQVMGDFPGDQIETVFTDQQAEKDENGTGVEEVGKRR